MERRSDNYYTWALTYIGRLRLAAKTLRFSMMIREFLVDVAGHRIPIAQSGDQLRVLNRNINASLVVLRPNFYSLILEGNSHLIHVEKGQDSSITINGQTIHSEMVSERSELILHHGQKKEIREVVNELRAPMSGLIVNVMVQVGEDVAKGQGLIVLEAMKMENELQAPGAGQVKHIHVQEKDVVTRNTVLMEF